ncbi:acyl carrier protein [Kitasatospora kifunensis]|uniref:Acyl carrier protein n=1 Tax=Kitasatospora kifunensis TaxID=58351 RepID=A0A7W7R8K4_KITKI|nr:acyl carrier protein [Kitasatospora kifunensis]MBB4927408.1 acyl carrier protein [Kitasatospora kifunensis]
MSSSVDQVKAWILKRHPERTDIPADLDLIDNRLIDSLAFAEFLFLLEELGGQTIDRGSLVVDDFRTLARIEQKYLRAAVR